MNSKMSKSLKTHFDEQTLASVAIKTSSGSRETLKKIATKISLLDSGCSTAVEYMRAEQSAGGRGFDSH